MTHGRFGGKKTLKEYHSKLPARCDQLGLGAPTIHPWTPGADRILYDVFAGMGKGIPNVLLLPDTTVEWVYNSCAPT